MLRITLLQGKRKSSETGATLSEIPDLPDPDLWEGKCIKALHSGVR